MQESQLDNAISAIRVRFGSQALTRAGRSCRPRSPGRVALHSIA